MPKGFDGTYRLLVRRAWGQVAGGKVRVEVVTHFGTDKAETMVKHIELGDEEQVLAFDLADGRRRERIEDHQLTEALCRNSNNQQILAQQIAQATDPAVVASLLNSPGNNNNMQPNPLFPLAGNGAVGYQPVIVVLPEGTNFSATAVVSADRRYVRITCVPLFSGIAEVNTFNSSGTGDDVNQTGTGGQGYSGIFGPGGQQDTTQQNNPNNNNNNNNDPNNNNNNNVNPVAQP